MLGLHQPSSPPFISPSIILNFGNVNNVKYRFFPGHLLKRPQQRHWGKMRCLPVGGACFSDIAQHIFLSSCGSIYLLFHAACSFKRPSCAFCNLTLSKAFLSAALCLRFRFCRELRSLRFSSIVWSLNFPMPPSISRRIWSLSLASRQISSVFRWLNCSPNLRKKTLWRSVGTKLSPLSLP